MRPQWGFREDDRGRLRALEGLRVKGYSAWAVRREAGP